MPSVCGEHLEQLRNLASSNSHLKSEFLSSYLYCLKLLLVRSVTRKIIGKYLISPAWKDNYFTLPMITICNVRIKTEISNYSSINFWKTRWLWCSKLFDTDSFWYLRSFRLYVKNTDRQIPKSSLFAISKNWKSWVRFDTMRFNFTTYSHASDPSMENVQVSKIS